MIQLFFSKLKKLKIAVVLVLLIFFIVVGLIPKNVLASTYGECNYGAGKYDQNDCSSPAPSPSPTTNNTNSSSSKATTTTITSSFSIFDSSTNTNTTMSTDSISTFTTQYPTFSGHTNPYAKVIIEIDGIPVEVTADANGDWQYKVTNPLTFGEHSIKITIKDKDSNETISENTYKINIAEKTEVVNNKTTSPKNHRTCIIIGIIALILSAILLIWILIARRRRKKQRNY